jgi:hypothetical protein
MGEKKPLKTYVIPKRGNSDSTLKGSPYLRELKGMKNIIYCTTETQRTLRFFIFLQSGDDDWRKGLIRRRRRLYPCPSQWFPKGPSVLICRRLLANQKNYSLCSLRASRERSERVVE